MPKVKPSNPNHELQHRFVVSKEESYPHQASLQLAMWLDSSLESTKMMNQKR